MDTSSTVHAFGAGQTAATARDAGGHTLLFLHIRTLSEDDTRRLYSRASSCLAVFRALPHLAKTYVMRALYLDAAIPLTEVDQWIRPEHQL